MHITSDIDLQESISAHVVTISAFPCNKIDSSLRSLAFRSPPTYIAT